MYDLIYILDYLNGIELGWNGLEQWQIHLLSTIWRRVRIWVKLLRIFRNQEVNGEIKWLEAKIVGWVLKL